MKSKLLRAFLVCLVPVVCIRFYLAGTSYSKDFHVYWSAVQAWMAGGSPYGALVAGDPAFVFKYPPWVLPYLAPLYLFTFEQAKAFWAILELLALASSVRSLVRLGLSVRVVLFSTALFWYIWLGHFYFGQIGLFFLAVSLWAVEKSNSETLMAVKSSIVVFFSSIKAFSMVSLIGIWKQVF
ncbi:MAG: DUF2029 domain-containing protein, partial [Bdellovibrio sp.]|nr:DUF2029 domain-containing protein [Bdellovibrio sp.]